MASVFFKISLIIFILLKSCGQSSALRSSLSGMESDILWEPAGEINHRVYCLLNTGTTLFAGTYNGLYRSADSGRTWSAAREGLTIATIRAMISKDEYIFVAGGILEGGICVSRDDGKSWTDVSAGLPNTSVSSLAFFGRSLFAGTFAYGIYVSEDNGDHWRPVNKGLPAMGGDITALASDGARIIACINSDTSAVYRSNDGSEWFDISRGLPQDHADFTSVIVRDHTILLSADGDSGGVFRTDDNGTSWTRLDLNDRSVSTLAADGTILFAGGFGGLQASTDLGVNWFIADNGLYPQGLPDVNTVLILRDCIYAGLNFGGVYRLTLPQNHH